MARCTAALFFLLAISVPAVSASAQELHQDLHGTWRAKVLEVVRTEERLVPGTENKAAVQTLTAEILEGDKKGRRVTFENDYIQLEKGDSFFLNHLITADGKEFYAVSEIDRRGTLLLLVLLFAAAVLVFGGTQGLKALASLAASFFIILYFLLPGILSGMSPTLASVLFSTLIVFIAMYATHGWKRATHAAFLGVLLAILFTGILAHVAIAAAKLSGFGSDAAVYLNFDTKGAIDFSELFLAAIIIGVLGILDDVAVTQASVVEELYRANNALSRWEVYAQAMRVGREHVGALINTLALAYVGASLPLLLLFSNASANAGMLVNQEIIAGEIVRTVAGSLGLIAAVPFTTALAALFLVRAR